MAKNARRMMSPEALELVAQRFKAMSEPLRLRILQMLEAGERNVSEITEVVESTQPNVSKHLKMMLDSGLVSRRQEGNTVYYSVADPVFFQICEIVCTNIQERLASQAEAFNRESFRAPRARRN